MHDPSVRVKNGLTSYPLILLGLSLSAGVHARENIRIFRPILESPVNAFIPASSPTAFASSKYSLFAQRAFSLAPLVRWANRHH